MGLLPASTRNELMNKDFKVPKIPTSLRILRDGAAGFQECRLFLSGASPFHHGPETVLEFLNGGSDFVPVEMEGKVNVLNLNHIVAFRDVSEHSEGVGRHILLTLRTTRLFTVQLTEILPESRGRIQDYLNTTDMFLEFVSENTRLFLNKNMIVSAADQ